MLWKSTKLFEFSGDTIENPIILYNHSIISFIIFIDNLIHILVLNNSYHLVILNKFVVSTFFSLNLLVIRK